jgi:hypothetical protein
MLGTHRFKGGTMFTKLVLVFALLALVVASAGTVPSAGPTYKITLLQPSVVKGTELKAGEYKLNVGPEKVTISNNKQSVEVPVKIENVEKKFDNTAIRYVEEGGKANISEIRVGGTKTRLVFNQ